MVAPHRNVSDQALAAEQLIAGLRQRLVATDQPLFVGLDGRSGAGKSTLAAVVAAGLGEDECGVGAATVIEGDGFYAGGSAEAWDARSAAEKAGLVIDWRRQHAVLSDLRERGLASWHPFDWQADDWDSPDVPLASELIIARALPVIILEGAYSCRPELHDLLDVRVLLQAPIELRRRQLRQREGDAYRRDWEARWSAAEDYYFEAVMPPERFDLVLDAGEM